MAKRKVKLTKEEILENKEGRLYKRRKPRISILNLVDIPRGIRINNNIHLGITKTFHS